jgi:preprotein translocase subunit SecE
MHEVAIMSKQHSVADHEETDQRDDEDGSARSIAKQGEKGKRKKDRMTAGTHWLFQFGLYKRTQGRIIRQVTFAALFLAVALGAWRISDLSHTPAFKYAIPLALVVVGTWVTYRLVNFPRFADFLIAVEAEMTKVSWPSRHQLIRSSIVVIVTIIAFALLLWLYDTIWHQLLSLLHV